MLIAEIGNNHFGSLVKAKDLINSAHDMGASFIKSQAFGKDYKHKGSMPLEFYEMIKFTTDEYLELIEYAKKIGNRLFFSVFYDNRKDLNEMNKVVEECRYLKVSASQSEKFTTDQNNSYDSSGSIISIPYYKRRNSYIFKEAIVLLANQYLWEPDKHDIVSFIENLNSLSDIYNYNIGISDHTLGIDFLSEVLKEYTPFMIEKHFTINKDIKYKGTVYRDLIHSCNPDEFYKLHKLYKGVKHEMSYM